MSKNRNKILPKNSTNRSRKATTFPEFFRKRIEMKVEPSRNGHRVKRFSTRNPKRFPKPQPPMTTTAVTSSTSTSLTKAWTHFWNPRHAATRRPTSPTTTRSLFSSPTNLKVGWGSNPIRRSRCETPRSISGSNLNRSDQKQSKVQKSNDVSLLSCNSIFTNCLSNFFCSSSFVVRWIFLAFWKSKKSFSSFSAKPNKSIFVYWKKFW